MTGCECNPREATIDADLNIVCAECGAVLEEAEVLRERERQLTARAFGFDMAAEQ